MSPTFLFLSLHAALATPQLTEEAKSQAREIARIGNHETPIGRLLIAMKVIEKKLNENARFALAAPYPNIVEMVENAKMRNALEFLIAMPPTERNELRRGETILRTPDRMSPKESRAAKKLLEKMSLPFDGLKGIRIGSFDRLNVTVQINTQTGCLWWTEKKTTELQLAWPGTPVRNEKSRNKLTKLYNARPDLPYKGANSIIPLKDPSFESYEALEEAWSIYVGRETPKGTVEIDDSQSFDGKQSLRFYNSKKTRSFPRVIQWVKTQANDEIIATFYAKSENLRIEQITTPSSYADEAQPEEATEEATEEEKETEDLVHALDPGDDKKWKEVVYNWDKKGAKITYIDPKGNEQIVEEDSEAGLHLISKLDWQPGFKAPKDAKETNEENQDDEADDKTNTMQQKLGLYAQFYDDQNHPIGTAESLVIGTGTKRWTQYQVDLLAPSDAKRLQLSFRNEYSGTLWIDGVTLQRK